jgi:hypothetical protein
VSADVNQENVILFACTFDKLKHEAKIMLDAASPSSFELSFQLMGSQLWIERIVNEQL